MNRINPAKLSQSNFRGIKNMDKELKTLDNGIKHIIQELSKRAEREVPPYGDFAPVYEQFLQNNQTGGTQMINKKTEGTTSAKVVPSTHGTSQVDNNTKSKKRRKRTKRNI